MAVTADQVRRMALALPEAAEGDDHGTPAFTTSGKIFCTLGPLHLTVKLAPDDQDNLAAGHPGVIEPVAGYWGRKGWTTVDYDRADESLIDTLLNLAWRTVAPKRPLKPPA